MFKTALVSLAAASALFLGCGVANASPALDRIGGIDFWGDIYCNPVDTYGLGELNDRKLLVAQVVWDSVFRAHDTIAHAQAAISELNTYCVTHHF